MLMFKRGKRVKDISKAGDCGQQAGGRRQHAAGTGHHPHYHVVWIPKQALTYLQM